MAQRERCAWHGCVRGSGARIHPAKTAYHTDDRDWQLLCDPSGALYLLVHCATAQVSYECLIQLNRDELRDYHGLGWLSVQHLASRIQYFKDDYQSRCITGTLLCAAIEAAAQPRA
ncbi:hypothetical protein ACTSKR_11910 [Chitinibacteraceae bacterium HSL-7]